MGVTGLCGLHGRQQCLRPMETVLADASKDDKMGRRNTACMNEMAGVQFVPRRSNYTHDL